MDISIHFRLKIQKQGKCYMLLLDIELFVFFILSKNITKTLFELYYSDISKVLPLKK